MTNSVDYESQAAALVSSGNYRVLRRLQPRHQYWPHDGRALHLGAILDLETTGLDTDSDEILEISILPFRYCDQGLIFDVFQPFHSYRQPSLPIPEMITRLTGITDDMVRGHVIDERSLRAFVAPIELIVAHNAAFDRKFAERFSDIFSTKAWACSYAQVPWRDVGFDVAKLSYLAFMNGFFYDGHRAVDDCAACLEILSRPLPVDGMPAFTHLLNNARQKTVRVWAANSPFGMKDVLKKRKYQWSDGSDGRLKSWFIDVKQSECDQEVDFLRREIFQYGADIPLTHISAYERFSVRV